MNDNEVKALHDRLRKFSQQLPTDTQDEYYASQEARMDTVVGEANGAHFMRLQRVKNEYDQLADAVPVGQGFLTFEDYVREYYGVKLTYDGNHVTLAYTIVDEAKYTVFLLKFDR